MGVSSPNTFKKLLNINKCVRTAYRSFFYAVLNMLNLQIFANPERETTFLAYLMSCGVLSKYTFFISLIDSPNIIIIPKFYF